MRGLLTLSAVHYSWRYEHWLRAGVTVDMEVPQLCLEEFLPEWIGNALLDELED